MMKEPEYKKGDKVIIYLPGEFNAGYHVGEVWLVDRCGTWDNGNKEPSYDVLIHDYIHPDGGGKISDCVCKHHTESEVKPYTE